jgi:maleate isomerase
MYGHRARIGYTSPPSATEVFPYEFYRIVPAGVTLVLHTLPLIERTGEEVDRSYDHSLRVADVMRRAGIDVMVFGGLPINVSRGFANAEDMRRAMQGTLGIPVITSWSAQQDAHTALGSRKVGVIQPYGDDHGERHLDYVRRFGRTPTGQVGLGAKFIELGKVDEANVLAAGRRLMRDHPDTDTIHIYCPHLATARITAKLEQEFGITVLASLQAIVWKALRTAGIGDRIEGFGRLLGEF